MSRAKKTGVTIAIITLAVLTLLGGAIYLRARAAPEAARLLPEGDTILYFNLRPVRLATDLGRKQVEHEPEYDDFVRQTGFQFERDLDEAAFAVHSSASGNSIPNGDSSRYSEVLVGRFNSERVNAYLRQLSTSVEHYRTHDIYNIPHEERTVRVSILAPDMVAASNTDDPRQIHHVVDQYEKSALPFGGPELVRDFYGEVPFGSLAWLISHSPARSARLREVWVPEIVSQLMGGGVVVASLRYSSAVHLRADVFVSGDRAAQLSERLNGLLSIYRGFDSAAQLNVSEADVKAAVDSIKVEQHSDRVSLLATLPREVVARLFEAPVETSTPAAKPNQSSSVPKSKRRDPGKR